MTHGALWYDSSMFLETPSEEGVLRHGSWDVTCPWLINVSRNTICDARNTVFLSQKVPAILWVQHTATLCNTLHKSRFGNRRITVSVFVSTLQRTALLWKSGNGYSPVATLCNTLHKSRFVQCVAIYTYTNLNPSSHSPIYSIKHIMHTDLYPSSHSPIYSPAQI